jgi:SAM-dependent methyltransferase
MGMIEDPPASTDFFYEDGYYGAGTGSASGYADYELTASHTQLWAQLLASALFNEAAQILDIGCADGTMLAGLPERFTKFGIEANATAAKRAAERGITVLSHDVADPRIRDNHGSFDIVSAIATFEHVLDMRGAFDTALHLLKPNGLLIFEVPLVSETADNKDWFHGSYEHITYPTVAGLSHLLNSFPGVFWTGFESQIKGFSASYIAVAARSEAAFARAQRLLGAMSSHDDPTTLPLEERQLNIAYRLVHCFEARPELVLALPDLFEVARSKPLLRRLSQIWYADAVKARGAEYYQQQAQNWQAAWNDADKAIQVLQAELARRDSEG